MGHDAERSVGVKAVTAVIIAAVVTCVGQLGGRDNVTCQINSGFSCQRVGCHGRVVRFVACLPGVVADMESRS